MSPRSIGLIVKQFRFELVVIVATLLLIAALELLVLVSLPRLSIEAEACGYDPRCGPLVLFVSMLNGLGGAAPPVASFVGAFGGLLLGVSVVGREVDRGTATLAWPLARSRRRWLAPRVIIIGTILILAAAAPALLADLLVSMYRPQTPADSTFYMFEMRGFLPIGRDLAAFAIGVLAGAAFGRVLPGLLLALVLAPIGYMTLSLATTVWRSSEAIVVDGGDYETNLIFDSRLRDASGQMLTWNDAYTRDQGPDGSVPDGWPDATYTQVTIGLPGDRRPDIDRREAAMYGGIAILLIVASAAVVDRRRPY